MGRSLPAMIGFELTSYYNCIRNIREVGTCKYFVLIFHIPYIYFSVANASQSLVNRAKRLDELQS